MTPMKRALVSVSDKTGLIEFLKPLCALGLELVSTGGTLKFLKENHLPATDIAALTGFPEALDGRVKTLHPFVHMGLLADTSNPSHMEQLKQYQLTAFDLVIGNLYPFEKVAKDPLSSESEVIENIDIGGPSFLRSSAKNYKSVVVLSDPADYAWVQEKIISETLTVEDKKKLAIKVFSLTSYYDALIVQKLADESSELNYLNLPLKRKSQLRYGENSQQRATWFENPLSSVSLATAHCHQGKELSYNNILDLDAAVSLVKQFKKPTCVAVKHNNPCAVAQAETSAGALAKAIQSDSKSIFGGILAFNSIFDIKSCEVIKDIFLECIIAPEFTTEALDFFKSKKNLRVLSWDQLVTGKQSALQVKSVTGGVLQQSEDLFSESQWTPDSSTLPEVVKSDMRFGEIVCGYLKSNSIAIVCAGQTLGLGMGQVNRVDAVQQAFLRFNQFQASHAVNLNEVVLVSDAFFPFADSIEMIAKQNIRWVLQPGGSTRDAEVLAAAKTNKINMVMSHQRHFRH